MLSFLASEYPPVPPEQAGFHLVPVPLESSVSYGSGTRYGPAALLEASQQLEAWEGNLQPGLAGFYTTPALDCSGSVEQTLDKISMAVKFALECQALPVVLGGEHTVTLGALRAIKAKFGDNSIGLVQFDAHADLRPSYEGNPLSHASVMYRAVNDLNFPLMQFGVREFCPQEAEIRQQFHVQFYDAWQIADCGLPASPLPPDFPSQIYLTFDVDALDASLMPATGTPSPGGFFWHDVRRLLQTISQTREIIGLDVVELAPIHGLHHANFTAAKLTHLLMGLAQVSGSGVKR